MPELSFWVPGIPQPQGSTKSFRGRGRAAHRIITTSDNDQLRPWRNAVTWQAQSIINGLTLPDFRNPPYPMRDAVWLELMFFLPRPAGHYGKAGHLLPSAPDHVITKPDLSKLVRAVEDSLTDAGVLVDDNRVVDIHTKKRYADLRPPGVQVTVTPMAQPAATPEVTHHRQEGQVQTSRTS